MLFVNITTPYNIIINLFSVFNTICLLIAAIDTKSLWVWIIFAVVLVLNIWINIEQLIKNRK